MNRRRRCERAADSNVFIYRARIATARIATSARTHMDRSITRITSEGTAGRWTRAILLLAPDTTDTRADPGEGTYAWATRGSEGPLHSTPPRPKASPCPHVASQSRALSTLRVPLTRALLDNTVFFWILTQNILHSAAFNHLQNPAPQNCGSKILSARL